MRTHLVVVADTERGQGYTFNPLQGRGRAVAVTTPEEPIWKNNDFTGDEKLDLRSVTIWSCMEEDVPHVVEELSKEWVGHDIKVFNLIEVHSRIPGELKRKRVEEDGVLP